LAAIVKLLLKTHYVMVKNLVITLLVILSLVSLGFSVIQKREAEKLQKYAEEMRVVADQQRVLARQNEQKAMEAAMEAMRQQSMAERALEECARKK
jgi:hypothetical protein